MVAEMSKQVKTQHIVPRTDESIDVGADLGRTIAELFYLAADLGRSNPEAARVLHYAAQDLERPSTRDEVEFREALLSEAVLSAIEQSLNSKH